MWWNRIFISFFFIVCGICGFSRTTLDVWRTMRRNIFLLLVAIQVAVGPPLSIQFIFVQFLLVQLHECPVLLTQQFVDVGQIVAQCVVEISRPVVVTQSPKKFVAGEKPGGCEPLELGLFPLLRNRDNRAITGIVVAVRVGADQNMRGRCLGYLHGFEY